MLAGLARLSDRRPLLVVTATATAAVRLAGDLACFVPPDDTAAGTDGAGGGAGDRAMSARWPTRSLSFPAWETLPFERVSPEVATMGQRMAALWHLGMGHLGMGTACLGEGSDIDGLVGPRIVVASVRAMLQRLVPWDEMPPPLVVRAGGVLDAGQPRWRPWWPPATAGNTRSSTGARSRCAAGSSTSSRRRRTCRSASTCGATRSTG